MMRSRFTAEEWAMLRAAPYLIGFGVVMADFTLGSMVKEFAQLGGIIKQTGQRYQGCVVVYELLRDTQQMSQEEMQKMQGMQTDSLMDMVKRTVSAVEREFGGSEAREFGYFLFEVAQEVARSAGENLFSFGDKVSEKEQAFLMELETWLGI